MPVAFLGALALLATRTCASDVAKVELRFAFGDAGAATQSLEVEVFRDDDRDALATFKRVFNQDGATAAVGWKLQLDPGLYTLELRVRYRGRLVTLKKKVEAVGNAAVVVNLESDLQAAVRRPPE